MGNRKDALQDVANPAAVGPGAGAVRAAGDPHRCLERVRLSEHPPAPAALPSSGRPRPRPAVGGGAVCDHVFPGMSGWF